MNAHRPKLAHLRSFVYVARMRSISKAAVELHVSQPTVTEHIQKLEEGYARKLFDRGPAGMSLTAAGEALRRMIEPQIDHLDTLTFDEKPMASHIGLGGPPDLLSLRVLPALAPLYDEGIAIRVRPGFPEQLLEQLESRILDMFIATRFVESKVADVTYQRLFDEEYMLVGNRDWRDRVERQADGASGQELERRVAEVLATAPFLAFDADLPLVRDHPLILKYAAMIFGADTLERVPLIMPDLRALREVAITGAGVAVIPRYIVQDALDSELFELHVPEHPKLNTLYIAHRKEPQTDVQQRLIDTLVADARTWQDEPARGRLARA
jgi:DNA-binding transcriptional LysR family regulator